MNINNLQIMKSNLVNIPSVLKDFLCFRYHEGKEIEKNISKGLIELGVIREILDRPETVKEYVQWFGRSIRMLDDPVAEAIREGTEINLQISKLTRNHIFRILSFTEDDSKSNLKMLPVEIKMTIICYLDCTYEEEMGKLDKQIEVLGNNLNKS